MARPTTLPPDWAALAEAVGGVSKLAAACGVTRTTIERWGAGDTKPSELTQKAVNTMAKRRGLTAPFAEEA